MKCKYSAGMLTGLLILLGAVTIAASAQVPPGVPPSSPGANAQTILTILPKKGDELLAPVNAANVAVKVDGKDVHVTGLAHYGSGTANLQLVLLIDDSARSSLGTYLPEMATFLNSLPPTVAVSVAYIENGAPRFMLPFTTDHAAAAKTLRLPTSIRGANADPYFALTALVDTWPGSPMGMGAAMRHEIVMVSDGVDPYYGLRYDPENPYVTKAIAEAQKHGVVIYSMYYKDRGRADQLGVAISSGQNYLIQLSQSTGGEMYAQGLDNPVSFVPFFREISRNLMNQYELGVSASIKVKDGLQALKVKVNAPNTKLLSASAIFVGEAAEQK